jgi:hypothetical protein
MSNNNHAHLPPLFEFSRCQKWYQISHRNDDDDKQNFQCKGCTKQFQAEYHNKGADPKEHHRVVAMLLYNSGIRDIESILGISRRTILSIALASVIVYASSHAVLPIVLSRLMRYRAISERRRAQVVTQCLRAVK